MSLFLSFSTLLSLTLISINFIAAATDNPVNFPATGLTSISVSVPKGRISLSSSKTQKDISVKLVESNKIYKNNKKCTKSIGLENSQLVVKISSENILFEKADCDYDVLIVTPYTQSFDLDISSGSALVSVRDVNGSINIKTATGSVSVEGDVLKNITAKTATGPMNFSYKTCNGRADLDFMTATGKMVLNVPATCKIRVDYKSATGKLFNAVGETENYQVLINAKSASGDLTIGKL